MNFIISTAIFLLALQSAICVPNGETGSSTAIKKGVKEYLITANTATIRDITKILGKISEKCPAIQTNFNDTIIKIRSCADKIDYRTYTICTKTKITFQKCFTPLLDLVSDCLPEESKQLPLLFQKAIVGFLNLLSDATVGEFLELFNPCHFEENWSDYKFCKQMMEKVGYFEDESKIPTNNDVCWLLPQVGKCSKDIEDASCHNPITKNIVSKLLESIKQEIKTVCRDLK